MYVPAHQIPSLSVPLVIPRQSQFCVRCPHNGALNLRNIISFKQRYLNVLRQGQSVQPIPKGFEVFGCLIPRVFLLLNLNFEICYFALFSNYSEEMRLREEMQDDLAEKRLKLLVDAKLSRKDTEERITDEDDEWVSSVLLHQEKVKVEVLSVFLWFENNVRISVEQIKGGYLVIKDFL